MKIKYIITAFAVVYVLLVAVLQRLPKPESYQDSLAHRTISLEKRYNNKYVNSVFEHNILLTLAYLNGNLKKDAFHKPFSFEMALQPGKTFAYHDQILPKYRDQVAYTTRAHFIATEGFESDGYLMGDGVCHLASLINWVAQEAGLKTEAPVNHDFATIPQVPRKYGVSIYTVPNEPSASAEQNLYVTNNRSNPVYLKFDFDGNNLTFSVMNGKKTLVRAYN